VLAEHGIRVHSPQGRIIIRATSLAPMGMSGCVRVSMCHLQHARRGGALSGRHARDSRGLTGGA
jgi:hypothetical protein